MATKGDSQESAPARIDELIADVDDWRGQRPG